MQHQNKQTEFLKIEPQVATVIVSHKSVMEKYNYLEQVISDVKDYITEQEISVYPSNKDELQQSLYDELFVSDSVTGNASGSYTFSSWQAEENLCHNLDLLKEALDEFGSDYSIMESAEQCDVTIRCYLLSEAISQALDELEEEEPEEQDEDEE